jgi:hypothetical protein
MIRRYGWPDKKTVAYFVCAAFPYFVTDDPKAVYRRLMNFSSYFHATGHIPELGYAPKVRLNYFDEFERFRKTMRGDQVNLI